MSTFTVTVPDEMDGVLVPAIYKVIVPEEQWGEMFRVVFGQAGDGSVRVTGFSDPKVGISVNRVDHVD